mgnify:CR=1 FL=1
MSLMRSFIGWMGFGPQDYTGTQISVPQQLTAELAAPVVFDTAMQLSAFWACARLIAETVAGLPLCMYRRADGSEVEPKDMPLLRLFDGKLNRYQTRVEFLETMVLNLAVHGNCYARIVRDTTGVIAGLVPMMAAQTECRTNKDGSRVYLYYTTEATIAYAEQNIWHVKLFGNGVVGLSPLGHARNALGIALASEKRVSQVFVNGAKPAGILMYDKILTPTQRQGIRDSFKDLVEGNDDSLLVLEAGMKFEAISMSPQDIELLASRRFQIEDVARFMGVPSVLVNDTASSTTWGSGIEQIIAGWYKLGLKPYLTRFEQSIMVNLMTPQESATYEVEFDFDDLLRADPAARFAGYQSAINAGVITPNEAREEEGRAPLEGGDQLLVNGTMVPIDQAGRSAQPLTPDGGSFQDTAKNIATEFTFERMETKLDSLARELLEAKAEMVKPKRYTTVVVRGHDNRIVKLVDTEVN